MRRFEREDVGQPASLLGIRFPILLPASWSHSKANRFIRFHAFQAISCSWMILIPLEIGPVMPKPWASLAKRPVGLLFGYVWIVLMIKAYARTEARNWPS